jgi:hypothetical protein
MCSDQPVGTGFSYANTDYVRDETGVAEDMYIFLQKFFALYPQYQHLDFYIIGERYFLRLPNNFEAMEDTTFLALLMQFIKETKTIPISISI